MVRLEKRGSLALLVSTNLKVLAPLQKPVATVRHQHIGWMQMETKRRNLQHNTNLDWVLRHMLATLALEPQHNLLGGFGLVELRNIKHEIVETHPINLVQ